MEYRIEKLPEKKLIGKRLAMSMANNKTAELWKSFMPRRKEITNNLTSELISMQVYDKPFDAEKFDPSLTFYKWAAVEVSDFSVVPEEMERFVLSGGLYAVFLHKGAASEGRRTFQYIFGNWLPHSDYSLDNRPHFELLGAKYKNDDPESEEEIWIPIQPKK